MNTEQSPQPNRPTVRDRAMALTHPRNVNATRTTLGCQPSGFALSGLALSWGLGVSWSSCCMATSQEFAKLPLFHDVTTHKGITRLESSFEACLQELSQHLSEGFEVPTSPRADTFFTSDVEALTEPQKRFAFLSKYLDLLRAECVSRHISKFESYEALLDYFAGFLEKGRPNTSPWEKLHNQILFFGQNVSFDNHGLTYSPDLQKALIPFREIPEDSYLQKSFYTLWAFFQQRLESPTVYLDNVFRLFRAKVPSFTLMTDEFLKKERLERGGDPLWDEATKQLERGEAPSLSESQAKICALHATLADGLVQRIQKYERLWQYVNACRTSFNVWQWKLYHILQRAQELIKTLFPEDPLAIELASENDHNQGDDGSRRGGGPLFLNEAGLII